MPLAQSLPPHHHEVAMGLSVVATMISRLKWRWKTNLLPSSLAWLLAASEGVFSSVLAWFFVGLRFSPPGFHQSLPKCIPDMATSDPKARENQRASETKNMGFLWPNLRNDISSVKAQKANQSLVYTQREKILQGWEYQGVGIIEDQFRNCWAQKFWVKQY